MADSLREKSGWLLIDRIYSSLLEPAPDRKRKRRWLSGGRANCGAASAKSHAGA
jgi:hypothetical protein